MTLKERQIISLWEANYTYSEIARRTGLGLGYIAHVIGEDFPNKGQEPKSWPGSDAEPSDPHDSETNRAIAAHYGGNHA